MSDTYGAGIRAFLGRVRASALDRRKRRALLREFDELNAGDRNQILDDVGMGYREFARAMMAPQHAENLNVRALEAIGVDPLTFQARHPGWARDMERLCSTCPARRRCRRDLAADVFGRQYRHYCANADSIDAIALGKRPQAAAAVAD